MVCCKISKGERGVGLAKIEKETRDITLINLTSESVIISEYNIITMVAMGHYLYVPSQWAYGYNFINNVLLHQLFLLNHKMT